MDIQKRWSIPYEIIILKEYFMKSTNSPSTSVQPHIIFSLEPLEIVNLYYPIS